MKYFLYSVAMLGFADQITAWLNCTVWDYLEKKCKQTEVCKKHLLE